MTSPRALPGNIFARPPGLERRHYSAARGTLFQTVFGITTGMPTYCYRSAFPNLAVDRSLERDWPTPVRIGAWLDTQKAERKSDIPMIHDPSAEPVGCLSRPLRFGMLPVQ